MLLSFSASERGSLIPVLSAGREDGLPRAVLDPSCCHGTEDRLWGSAALLLRASGEKLAFAQ